MVVIGTPWSAADAAASSTDDPTVVAPSVPPEAERWWVTGAVESRPPARRGQTSGSG
jgi:hypothetical protein